MPHGRPSSQQHPQPAADVGGVTKPAWCRCTVGAPSASRREHVSYVLHVTLGVLSFASSAPSERLVFTIHTHLGFSPSAQALTKGPWLCCCTSPPRHGLSRKVSSRLVLKGRTPAGKAANWRPGASRHARHTAPLDSPRQLASSSKHAAPPPDPAWPGCTSLFTSCGALPAARVTVGQMLALPTLHKTTRTRATHVYIHLE